MVKPTTEHTLSLLAERFIPPGTHRYLHVNSRKAWIKLMLEMLETGVLGSSIGVLCKCARNWELLLTRKISTQN